MTSTFEYFLPDFLDWLGELMQMCGGFLVAGVLAVFIFWAISYAIQSLLGWVNSWTKERE